VSRPLQVLVVDDFPDSGETTAQLLALYGHDARTSRSRAEALRVVAGGFTPDVAVLDLRLGDGDGYDLAGELDCVMPRRPILIAVTGVQGQDERCRAAGFEGCLLKPAEPAELVALVDRCSAGRE